jgi:hypothetical protein
MSIFKKADKTFDRLVASVDKDRKRQQDELAKKRAEKNQGDKR